CNESPLSEKHAICFFQLLAYEQDIKEPYNEHYYGAIEIMSVVDILECSKAKKAADFNKLNPLLSVQTSL
uniref:Uncharacterized protein n=1 Tax=Amphimedon queenslandica TaxID=400682 RepID=A0A1X7SLD6_AMPQE